MTPERPADSGEGTILVIDDSGVVRGAITQLLAASGYRSLAVADGRAGIEAVRESPDGIVAVILDLEMPGIDGIETFRALRSFSDLPVLFVSGYGEVEIRKRVEADGRVGQIRKPFSLDSLSEALRVLLEA